MGLEEGDRAKRGKKHAEGMFFSPGESPWTGDGRRYACWHLSILFFCLCLFDSVEQVQPHLKSLTKCGILVSTTQAINQLKQVI